MRQTSAQVLSIWPHIAVTKVKGAQIKANIFEPLLENNNNHQKEAEAVKAFSESKSSTIEERNKNTNLTTEVSTKRQNQIRAKRQ